MKKLLFLLILFLNFFLLKAQNKSKNWYWVDGKQLNRDSIGSGSINNIIGYTKMNYLAVDIRSNPYHDIILYKPLVYLPLMIYTHDTITLKKSINWFFKQSYFYTFNFISDFEYLISGGIFLPNKEHIKSLFGDPDEIVPCNEPNREQYFYNKFNFHLLFIGDQLVSFERIKTNDTYISELERMYGENFGTDIYYEQVDIGMTSQMVILSLGLPKSINTTTTFSGVSQQWIYRRYPGDDIDFDYYYFFNNKLTSIQN